MPSVTIDYQLCKGAKECGECYHNCPMEVFTVNGDRVVVSQEEICTGCGVCEDLCPTNAIKVKFE